ncbi:hypothetical protein D6783_00325 [Candidatus Woesearchaeota archaeon]|nr:MAG: hypothetical protein D6783_00325 [Candidatus Woesearchaeota archaeon]
MKETIDALTRHLLIQHSKEPAENEENAKKKADTPHDQPNYATTPPPYEETPRYGRSRSGAPIIISGNNATLGTNVLGAYFPGNHTIIINEDLHNYAYSDQRGQTITHEEGHHALNCYKGNHTEAENRAQLARTNPYRSDAAQYYY